MTRLAEIQGHIAGMDELQDIVGAMRSLAGMRVQEALRALDGIRRYAASMRAAIASALLLAPPAAEAGGAGRGSRALILFAAEHGFVGGFNERLVEAAEAGLDDSDTLFVLGGRGAALLSEHRRRVDSWRPMATRLSGAPDSVNQLTAELYARIARHELSRVEVLFARYRQGSASSIERRTLLPLDMSTLATDRPRQAPLHNVPPQALLERLMAEYVFALLMEAAVESIGSENAARFAAMESAHDNLATKLGQLRQEARQARQSEITAELLDLITGAEAIAPQPPVHASPAASGHNSPAP